MEQCWRWYGPDDPVTLDHVKQAGATGVVSALHDIYDGRAWPLESIQERKRIIEAAGLTWSVVESIPVHNSFKIGAPERVRYAGYYNDSIRALAKSGIDIDLLQFHARGRLDPHRSGLPAADDGLCLAFRCD